MATLNSTQTSYGLQAGGHVHYHDFNAPVFLTKFSLSEVRSPCAARGNSPRSVHRGLSLVKSLSCDPHRLGTRNPACALKKGRNGASVASSRGRVLRGLERMEAPSKSGVAAAQGEKTASTTGERNAEDDEGEATGTGLSALDAYFDKLRRCGTGSSDGVAESKFSMASPGSPVFLPSSSRKSDAASPSSISEEAGKQAQGLKALDAYFQKLNLKRSVPEQVQEEQVKEQAAPPVNEAVADLTEEELFMKSLMDAKEDYKRHQSAAKDEGNVPKADLKFQVTSNSDMDLANWEMPEEESTNSNLINVLVAMNIAVYLFGLASPHEAHGITDSSLPVVYGAKINELMLGGQWWRFITPMFLHASLLHVGLGSWALLSFGPAVESAYGGLGFAMIYFLGGLFGTMASLFHTTEWTVGGTGPIYALVGTWIVYLLKNREIIGKGIADEMIRKVVILSAVNAALCNSLPIDDWTHLGAILIGTVFGVLASPTMQLNVAVKDASHEREEEDAAAYLWFNDKTSQVRLGLVFALCLGIFFTLYQLSVTGSADFYLLQDNDVF